MRRAELRQECDRLALSLATRKGIMEQAWQTGSRTMVRLLSRPSVLIVGGLAVGFLLANKRYRGKLGRLRPLVPTLLRAVRAILANRQTEEAPPPADQAANQAAAE